MADITMCRNEECKIKDECYRYTAPVDKYWQSVFMENPKDIPCSYFWDNKGYRKGKDIGKWWMEND